MLDPSIDDIFNWISPITNSKSNEKTAQSDKPNRSSRSQSPISEPESVDSISSASPWESERGEVIKGEPILTEIVKTDTKSTPASCEECQVAMKDHLLQIYDPFIDYCARCQEAEKDHQLKNIDCSLSSVRSDCMECFQSPESENTDLTENSCSSNTNNTLTMDILPPSPRMLSKKALLENQIQPKYSDSRHESVKRRFEFDQELSNQRRKKDVYNDLPRQYQLLLYQSQQQQYLRQNDMSEGEYEKSLSQQSGPPHDRSQRSLYCHWNGHENEVEFNSELALQAHLRNHIYPQPESNQLACQWDSCDVSLKFVDELLEHIRTDHYNNYGQPHENCSHERTNEKLSLASQDGSYMNTSTNSHPYSPTTQPHSHVLSLSPHTHSHSHSHPHTHTHAHSLSPHTHPHSPHTHSHSFKCQWNNCQYVATSSDLLGRHVLNDHINSTQLQSQPDASFMNNGTTFQCQYQSCDFESINLEDFTSHIKSDHLTALDKFLADGSLPTLPDTNSNFDKTTPSTTTHTCKWILADNQLCDCKFQNTQQLSDHIIKTHIGLRKNEYICSWQGCDRNHRPFQQRQKMVRHLQVHTNHRPFKCDICGSTFGEEGVLKQHLRVHSGERPFECKICHKKFAASAALSVHLRVHTGEKPLKCKYPGCEKRFSESSNLNKHLKTHFTGYPCICPICKESFADADQLHKHFKGH